MFAVLAPGAGKAGLMLRDMKSLLLLDPTYAAVNV
jgi:hypothetical protein